MTNLLNLTHATRADPIGPPKDSSRGSLRSSRAITHERAEIDQSLAAVCSFSDWSDFEQGAPVNAARYRRLVPVTTMLTLRLPHREHTSRSVQSGTVVSAPYWSAISAGSGSTWWRQFWHH